MKPADRTAASQSNTITFELELTHSPAKVWRAITDAKLLSEWLLPVVELQLSPGAAFQFQAPAQPGWDGAVNCRVLEIEAHRKLCYAWVVDDDPPIDTVVTFTLTPTTAGTRLLIEQSGFAPTQKAAFGGARYGWNMMSEQLIETLGRTT